MDSSLRKPSSDYLVREEVANQKNAGTTKEAQSGEDKIPSRVLVGYIFI